MTGTYIRPIVIHADGQSTISELVRDARSKLIRILDLEYDLKEHRTCWEFKGSIEDYFDATFMRPGMCANVWNEEKKYWKEVQLPKNGQKVLLVFTKDMGLFSGIAPFILTEDREPDTVWYIGNEDEI